MEKKGQITQLQPLVVSLVAIAILLVVSFLILSQVAANTTVAADANAAAAVATVQTSMDDIPDWLPIIIVTVIGAILLGLVAFFRGRT